MALFAIGDIHGRFQALLQVLKDSAFDYENDKLIILGDIADGGIEVDKCVDELLKIKNKVFVLGNHDLWFLNWYLKISPEERERLLTKKEQMKRAEKYIDMYDVYDELIWTSQGGWNTIQSYRQSDIDLHKIFWLDHVYHHVEDNTLFIHGGVNKEISNKIKEGIKLTKYDNDFILWNRDTHKLNWPEWKRIFVGHTPTKSMTPETYKNVVMLDCGAGWDGKLCLYRIDNNKYWLSEKQNPCR